MVPLPDQAEREQAADLIIQSDVLTRRSAEAIVSVENLAKGRPATFDHIRTAARRHRAKLRVVAAAFGYVQCCHCADWVHVSDPIDGIESDPSACPHSLDIACDEQLAMLTVYVILSGQPIRQSISMPPGYAERRQRTTGRAVGTGAADPGRGAEAS
jgi:hypothetical protein